MTLIEQGLLMDSHYRILFVDDDPAVRRAFGRTLADTGCHVELAAAGEVALQLLAERPFDVVAADHSMPGMSGLELLRHARQVAPAARRLLVSGACDLPVAVEAINGAAVDRLILKPWGTQELREAVWQAAEAARSDGEARRLSCALRTEHAQLQDLSRDLGVLLEQRTIALLDSLVCALDLRDSETQWHSRRVAAYARHLGAAVGLSGEALLDVERGALLHDIGKIGVSDLILLKPGALTENEWAEMRRHPVLGYEMLRHIDFLEGARLVVLQHQERWDGGGYPAGLCGEEICLGARIFHIVDAYDAITSDRPYRGAQDHATARAEILRCAGEQFDPELVRVFCNVEEERWEQLRRTVCAGRGVEIV